MRQDQSTIVAVNPGFDVVFNDTATTEIYTLSLHDALPIWGQRYHHRRSRDPGDDCRQHPDQAILSRSFRGRRPDRDRKSTRLNSSHSQISYAVFCLKKKDFNTPLAPQKARALVSLRSLAAK